MLQRHSLGLRGLVLLAACSFPLIQSATAAPAPSYGSHGYIRTNLITDVSGVAPQTDPNLLNGWGIAALPGGPWWVAANHTGLSTVYDGTGAIMSLVVTIPPSAATGGTGSPTGIVANSTTDFGGSLFLFDSEDGVISGWTSGTAATIKVDNGAAGAIYKGLAMAQMGSANFLYAANFHAGTVEVYDANFAWVDLGPAAFKDPTIPAGFAPFNVQTINGAIFVMYAKQDADAEDEVAGPGLGFVDAFTTEGALIRRYQHGPWLNAPWGAAVAPSDFGDLSGSLLIGQFGSGRIIAYDLNTGVVKGTLNNGNNGLPITIPGLWGIGFGNDGAAGPANSLYFAAGPKDEEHGLYGVINKN